MAALNHAEWPNLAKSWDDYGMQVKFAECDGIKVRSDNDEHDGKYVVVRYKKDGMVEIADLYRLPDGSWEFCNDGFDPMTEKQWNTLRIKPYCDSFTVGAGWGD